MATEVRCISTSNYSDCHSKVGMIVVVVDRMVGETDWEVECIMNPAAIVRVISTRHALISDRLE